MFGDLRQIVDLLRGALSDARRARGETEREETVLNLLRAYFLFKDCVDEGARLVEEAGPDPVARLRAMEQWEAAATIERWDAILERQVGRLQELDGFIFGQHHIGVLDPALQEQARRIIGSKSERATSLHGIGAALFFRFMFGFATSNEERARYVAVMAGAEEDLLDMTAVKAEISDLRDSLERYRGLVERLVSDEEILRLSRQARNETLRPRP